MDTFIGISMESPAREQSRKLSRLRGEGSSISNRVSLPSKNAAGHEAFHLWGSTEAREAYANEVADNLNYSSRGFVEYQAVIAEAYLGGEADLSDSTQLQKLREELFAYISGDIHEGVNDDLLWPMFDDYDAVKAAWEKLCKGNSGGEVRFSVREVGGETMPVLDIQNDTRDYKVAGDVPQNAGGYRTSVCHYPCGCAARCISGRICRGSTKAPNTQRA